MRTQDVTRRSLLWRWLQMICRVVTTVLLDLKTYDIQNVPKRGGFILAPNHQSYLDPVLATVHLYRAVGFMAKSELFFFGFGWLIRALHAFPIQQGKGDRQSILQTVELLKRGFAVNIFPEGSRTENGIVAPLMAGVGLVAKRAEVPIVPVAITGSYAAWPKGHAVFHPSPIRVKYGKPIDTTGLTAGEIMKRLDADIRRLLAELERDHSPRLQRSSPHTPRLGG